MKKLVLTLVMGVFAFGSSGFKANNFQPVDCTKLAIDVHDAWTEQGFTDQYAGAQADAAYEDCVKHNGVPESEVIVKTQP